MHNFDLVPDFMQGCSNILGHAFDTSILGCKVQACFKLKQQLQDISTRTHSFVAPVYKPALPR